jgi:hypothetical protein
MKFPLVAIFIVAIHSYIITVLAAPVGFEQFTGSLSRRIIKEGTYYGTKAAHKKLTKSTQSQLSDELISTNFENVALAHPPHHDEPIAAAIEDCFTHDPFDEGSLSRSFKECLELFGSVRSNNPLKDVDRRKDAIRSSSSPRFDDLKADDGPKDSGSGGMSRSSSYHYLSRSPSTPSYFPVHPVLGASSSSSSSSLASLVGSSSSGSLSGMEERLLASQQRVLHRASSAASLSSPLGSTPPPLSAAAIIRRVSSTQSMRDAN